MKQMAQHILVNHAVKLKLVYLDRIGQWETKIASALIFVAYPLSEC